MTILLQMHQGFNDNQNWIKKSAAHPKNKFNQ